MHILESFIILNYLYFSNSEIAKMFSVSRHYVSKVKLNFNLESKYNFCSWTRDEIEYVLLNFETMSISSISTTLNCSFIKVHKLLVSIFGKYQSFYLESLASNGNEKFDFINTCSDNFKDVSLHFGISESTARYYIRKYSEKYLSRKFWNKEEIIYLKNNIHLGHKIVSENLLRTKSSVLCKANKLGLSSNSKTWVETAVEDFLKSHYIFYEYNKYLGKYYPDFVIDSMSLVVDVHGDYWHGNPELYTPDDLNNVQKYNIQRDSLKNDYYESIGYNYIVIWEKDIVDNYNNLNNFLKYIIVV